MPSTFNFIKLTPFLVLGQLVIGLMSFLATAALFGGGVFATICAFIITVMAPHIVALTAVIGAIQVWDWPWILAIIIFMWPVVLFVLSILGIVAGTTGLSAYAAWRSGKMKNGFWQETKSSDILEGEYTIIRDQDEDAIGKD